MVFGPRATMSRLVVVATAFVVVSGAVAVVSAAVQRPPGAGAPPAGTGIGTSAALDNPRCTHDDPRYGVYGRFNTAVLGGGTVCVRPWKDGADNGGATSRGVTKNAVTVVGVIPNDAELSAVSRGAGTAAVNRVDDSTGTYADAVHDYLLPMMKFYETWGRDIEMKFVVSSGGDEAAQRADVVTIKSEKPFAVVNFVVGTGLDTLETELAKSKILVWGAASTNQKALAQAPYRWGPSDAQAAGENSAELIGKQLVGKKATFAGSDEIKSQTRKFAAVYIPTLLDIAEFKSSFKKYGGRLASEYSYTSPGTTFGDPALAEEQAPVVVTKMKDAGVTTVILFSDTAMNKAMMTQATNQEWFPEWYLTGALFQDIAILARGYPPEQAAQMFGVSNLAPFVQPDPTPAPPAKSLTVLSNALNWYWGESAGTQVTSVVPQRLDWLLNGIQTAGPKLTPQTFKQGLFSIPASGGAASGYPTGALVGYGRTPGLPYDEYMLLGLDFAPVSWDAETTGPSNGIGTEGKGVVRYVDGGKRYRAGTWPKQPFKWFDKAGSVVGFATRQIPAPVYAGDCSGCPATGGAGQVGTPSAAGFVAKANGAGQTAPS